jgi:HD-GYP domain-containing protein (c-di-GMP phosphodiesterase class II)
MTEPGALDGLGAVDRLISQTGAAIAMRALYSAGHPNVDRAVRRMLAAVEDVLVERRQAEITLLVVGPDLVVDQRPLHRASLYHEQFARALGRRGVERLTLARGLTEAECGRFLEAMAVGGSPQSSEHIVVGQVEVKVVAGVEGEEHDERLTLDALEGAREAFSEIRRDKRAALRRLDGIVWGLMDGLAAATREVIPLAPLKTHDEYTFVHSVNVSMLTLAQARGFGIAGDTLHAIGLAAMLHDIGKLRIPLEVLNKPGKLEGDEWRMMMSHAEAGARHLCSLDAAIPLAILVAYEHHMRYDGQPSYPKPRVPRTPNLASQMTSISDVYDAICTTRPYSQAKPRHVAIGILRDRAGTWHDPLLVANMARIVGVDPG